MMMKKERPILFPVKQSINVVSIGKDQISLNDLSLGEIYRIGKPSDRYYESIYPVIDPDSLNAQEFEEFSAIQGFLIKVTSILRMLNGKRIAVLRHHQDEPFLNKFGKIYAHVDLGITTREIIPLDLETKLALESTMKTKS